MTQRQVHNYTCTLSEDHLDKAKRELNEDPETRKLEIQTLRERLLRYPGLTSRVDDAFLLKFLRGRKFDQERTFELILNYYRMKKDNEDIYAEMTPKSIKTFLETDMVTVLPKAGKEGETVVVYKSGLWDTDRYGIEFIFKCNYILMTTIMESEEAQVDGVRFIYDLKGFSLGHCTACSPSMCQKMAFMVQDAFPVRVKGMHYVHEHSIFDYVFAIIKPFMKEKLTKRTHFHGTKYSTLHEFIHPEHLPEEYGGSRPFLSPQEYLRGVFEKESDFEEDTKFGFVSMTIKQESKKSADAIENLPGTFKKLNVD